MLRYLIALLIAAVILATVALFSSWNHDAVARIFAMHKRELPEGKLPVTIHVIDTDTAKAIPEFRYRFWVYMPGEGTRVEEQDWRLHKSATEPLQLHAPISCQLVFELKARGYLGGQYRTRHTFDLKTTDKERKPVIKLERGIVVTGSVRDAQTKMPVPGAQVMPYQPVWPGFRGPDVAFAVRTDKNGLFTVPGVHSTLGVFVNHGDYLDAAIETKKESDGNPGKDIENKQVLLVSGRSVEGRVTAPDGRPLENVEVACGLWRRVQTSQTGRFLLRGLEKGRETISFKKKGYITNSLDIVDKTSLGTVVLQPLYKLRGRVVDAEGRHVRRFLIMAGPGQNPPAYSCTESTVAAGNDFALELEKAGKHWVGVRAEGHAAWEGWTEVARDMDPITIKLSRGAVVTGKAELPSGIAGEVEATLTPGRPDAWRFVVDRTPARDLATLRAALQADGSFKFEHVRPDQYVLSISGKHVSEHSQPLTVVQGRNDAKAIEIQRAGRIVGQVCYGGGGPWAFAQGEIHRGQDPARDWAPITFIADEDGRFEVDGVPAGKHRVSIPHQLNDIVFADTLDVQVLAGRTTGVRFPSSAGVVGTVRQDAARLLARSWYVWAPMIVLVSLAVAALMGRRTGGSMDRISVSSGD
jgi:hypothetical protein